MQNYRAKAETIALEAFWKLTPIQQHEVLSIKPKTRLYFEKFRQNIQKIPKKHLKVLLETIFEYLPTATQCELLWLDLSDLLETYRQKLIPKKAFNVDEAFDLYSQYLTFLYGLHKFESKWFFKADVNTEDWQEVVETFKCITVTRLRASALHFKKDLQIIADNSQRIAAKVIYKVDFLGIEVHIKATNYSLDRLFAFDDFPIPIVVGKFTETLKAYIFDAFQDTQYQLAIQEMQDGLLAQDFKVALEHYKESKPLFNKVDFSFSLQGGAGLVSMNIQTWASIGKRIFAPLRKFFSTKPKETNVSPIVVNIFIVSFVGLVALILWGTQNIGFIQKYTLQNNEQVGGFLVGFIVFAFMIGSIISHSASGLEMIREDGKEFYVQKKIIPKEITIDRTSTFEYAVNAKRLHTQNQLQSENPIEKAYQEVLQHIRQKRYVSFKEILYLDEIISICSSAVDDIQCMSINTEYVNVIRCLLLKKVDNLLKICLHILRNKNILPILYCYLPFFDVERQINFTNMRDIEKDVEKLFQKITNMITYPLLGENEQALQDFWAGKLQEMQEDQIWEDLEELAQPNPKNISDANFLLEGEEIVARLA